MCFCLKALKSRYKCNMQMVPTSEINVNHNREEVETRAVDGLFVDFP
jgi:hypothetical protein